MDPIEHANNTNPCVGICVYDDDDRCVGCYRLLHERRDWNTQTNEWREQMLVDLKIREDESRLLIFKMRYFLGKMCKCLSH